MPSGECNRKKTEIGGGQHGHWRAFKCLGDRSAARGPSPSARLGM